MTLYSVNITDKNDDHDVLLLKHDNHQFLNTINTRSGELEKSSDANWLKPLTFLEQNHFDLDAKSKFKMMVEKNDFIYGTFFDNIDYLNRFINFLHSFIPEKKIHIEKYSSRTMVKYYIDQYKSIQKANTLVLCSSFDEIMHEVYDSHRIAEINLLDRMITLIEHDLEHFSQFFELTSTGIGVLNSEELKLLNPKNQIAYKKILLKNLNLV